MKKLAIVVSNYNGEKLLKQFFNSIENLLDKQVDLIVVDNNSTDGSRKYLKSLESRGLEYRKKRENSLNSKLPNPIPLTVIFNDQNLGFTGGNNVGIRYALKSKADYIMLLNNDILVKNKFWQPMIDYLERNTQVGLVSPKIYFATGYETHKAKYKESELGQVIWYAGGKLDWQNIIASHTGVDEVDQGQYDQPKQTGFATGCCLVAPADIWREVGLLDDRYYLYYEDSDYSQQVKQAGYEVHYLPDAVIWHLNAGSSVSGGQLHDYFISRNRLIFGMKWADLRAKSALLRESIRTLFKGRKWQKIGVRDYYLRKFNRGSWK